MTDKDCQELQKRVLREFDQSRKRTEQGLKRQKPNDWFSQAEKFNKTLEK